MTLPTTMTLDLSAAAGGLEFTSATWLGLLNANFGAGLRAVTALDLAPVPTGDITTTDGNTVSFSFTGPNAGMAGLSGFPAAMAPGSSVYFVDANAAAHDPALTQDIPAVRITPLGSLPVLPDIAALFSGTFANQAAFYTQVAAVQLQIDAYYTALRDLTFSSAGMAGFDSVSVSGDVGAIAFGAGDPLTMTAFTPAYVQGLASYTVTGTGFDDTLQGVSATANVINGGAGDDTVIGSAGADAIDGGGGTGDTVDYSASGAGVTVDLTAGTGSGGMAAGDTYANLENVTGSSSADTLTGNVNANTLTSGGGNDTLNGGEGNDTLDGGDNTDRASYDGAGYGVDIDLVNNLTHKGLGGAETDTLVSIENVTGSGLDDTIRSGTGANAIDGGGGVDTLIFTGSGAAVTVDLGAGTGLGGTAEGDTYAGVENVTGSGSGDTLKGSAGDNVLTGGLGADTIEGGAGADTLDGGGHLGDMLSYAGSAAGVNVNLATGVATGGDAAGDVIVSNSFFDLRGSGQADTLTGNSAINRLEGGDGDDTLDGGLGPDVLAGGAGTDTVTYLGSAATGVTVDLTLATAQAGGGDAAGDVLSGIENITGSNFGDTLKGTAGVNVIQGGTGNDTIEGGAGADTLGGGDDIDTLRYTASIAAVTVNLAASTASGGDAEGDVISGFENVTGSGQGDTLTGNGSANNIQGGLGNDTILGGGGADTLDGGAGIDTLSYAGSAGAVTVNLLAGTATGTAPSDADGDIISGFENVTGTAHKDLFVSGTAANTFDGGASIDTVSYALSGTGVTVNLGLATAQATTITTGTVITGNGTASGDVLINIENLGGSGFADTLTGSAGDNALSGGAGNDIINGGAGNDTVRYDTLTESGPSGVTVNLTTGVATDTFGNTDTLIGIENVIGSTGNDIITGSAGSNRLEGAAGDDTLNGGAGADTFVGGSGNDIFDGTPTARVGNTFFDIDDDWIDYRTEGGTSGVTVTLGTSTNTTTGVSTGTATDTFGNTDTLIDIEGVYGTAFADTITGGGNSTFGTLNNSSTGYEFFSGLAGADIINGMGGNDEAQYHQDARVGGTSGIVANLSANALMSVTSLSVLYGSIFTAMGITPAIDEIGADSARDGFGDIDTLISVERIRGTQYSDVVIGVDNENNRFRGLDGADFFVGGAGGTDEMDYARDHLTDGTHLGGTNGVVVNLGTTAFSATGLFTGVFSTVTGTGSTLTSIGAETGRDAWGNLDRFTGVEAARGSIFNDLLIGGSGDERLYGDQGNDRLIGGAGSDRFTGGSGNDILDGRVDGVESSGGNDRVVYIDEENGTTVGLGAVTVNLATGVATDTFGNTDTLLDIEAVAGTRLVDTLTGGNIANDDYEAFFGLGGNDIINGGSGYDESRYDDDTNWSAGGSALSTTLAGVGVIVNLSAVSQVVTGFTPASVASSVTVLTSTGRDWTGGTDTLTSIEGARGTFAKDYFFGSTGDNTFTGLGGADVIDGGAGFDTASYEFDNTYGGGTTFAGIIANLSTAAVTVGAVTVAGGTVRDTFGATDTLISIENIRGSAGADHIAGGDVDNTFTGLSGNDIMIGGGRNDTFIGGAGNDVFNGTAIASDAVNLNDSDYDGVRYDKDGGTFAVTVNLATGVATDTHGNTDILIDIEEVRGSLLADRLTGGNLANGSTAFNTANSGYEAFFGLGGNDLINGGAGFDEARYDQDSAYSSGQSGVIINLGTTARSGTINTGTFTVAGGTARDGFGSTDTLVNIEAARGSKFADQMFGGNGDNRFRGLAGNDFIDGGNNVANIDSGGYHNGFGDEVSYNRDVNYGGVLGVTVNLGNSTATDGFGNTDTLVGIENVVGTAVNDTLIGDGGNNKLRGDAGNDVLNGMVGADRLEGGAGNDTLNGGAQNDILIGGTGSDNLTGGTGADWFRFNNIGEGVDTIVDFSQAQFDKIDLLNSGFSGANGVINSTNFVSNTTGLAASGTTRLIYNQTTDQLLYDADGSGAGAAVVLATFSTTTLNLTAADFRQDFAAA